MHSSVDWRDQLQLVLPVIRRESVKTVMKILERYNPNVDEERLLELQKIAQRFEETAYATATGLSHYQEKISSKMLAIEINLNLIINNWKCNQVGETLTDASDWRISLPLESRERIVNKIMDILKRHIPYSGEEGLHQLRVIAQRLEEKIYTMATSQSEYLRELSIKMLTMGTEHANCVL